MMDYLGFKAEIFSAEIEKFKLALKQLCDAAIHAKESGCHPKVIRSMICVHPGIFLKNNQFLMYDKRNQDAFKVLHSLKQDVALQMQKLLRDYPYIESILAKINQVLSSEYPEYAFEVFEGEMEIGDDNQIQDNFDLGSEDCEVTQNQAAILFNVSVRTVRNWETYPDKAPPEYIGRENRGRLEAQAKLYKANKIDRTRARGMNRFDARSQEPLEFANELERSIWREEQEAEKRKKRGNKAEK